MAKVQLIYDMKMLGYAMEVLGYILKICHLYSNHYDGCYDNFLKIVSKKLGVMYLFEPISASDIQKKLSADCRARRLEKNISQKTLSQMSGVPLSTLQRFEHTGEISLYGFLKIGRVLGYAQELMEVIGKPKYGSLDEMVRINKNKRRQRGTDE